MDKEFHIEVLNNRCPTCAADRGKECLTYSGGPVSPPHQRRWVKVAEARYKAYEKADKLSS